MDAGGICTRDVDTVEASENARDAARRMLERQVGTLVVLDADGCPVGILTDRDIALRVVAGGRPAETIEVAEIVTAPVRTIDESKTVHEAVVEMRAASCRRLPVVDGSGRMVGMLSLDDALEVLAEDLGRIARLLESESPHRPGTAPQGPASVHPRTDLA